MIKTDSHDSGVEYHSQHEQLIKDDPLSRARRARRQSRNHSATTTSGDETKREVPEIHSSTANLRPPPPSRRRRASPSATDLPPPGSTTTVTIQNETDQQPKRRTTKKKTFKAREGDDIEMTVRKRSGSRQRRRRASSKEPHTSGEMLDPMRDKILGIIIHRTDRLRTDLRLRHPIVRVHLIDINTRSYVRKSDPNRPVLRYHIQNEQPIDHISSISTQPYDFHENRSTIPSWEQMLILNEDYSYLTSVQQNNIVLFFEILDFLDNPSSNRQQTLVDMSRTFPIAWAFLKIVGARNTLNTERMLRLQLWQPNEQHFSTTALLPDVFTWFTQVNRQKYPSTLYITVKPLNPPTFFRSGLKSALDGGIEQMREEYRQLKPELEGFQPDGISEPLSDTQQMQNDGQTLGPLQRVAQLPPRWQKLPNSKCKIPTESLLILNASERGCSCIRFSHNGHFLACAEVNKSQQNNLLSIFEIPKGQRVTVFAGHLQLIYDLDWSKSDRFLASASADSSVKIWNFEHIQRKPWRSLAHPNYVYCVRFHPINEDLIITAGYDKLIRIWNIEKKHVAIIRMMDDHLGYISSLSFNPDGTRLASVDSIGAIKVWHGLPNEISASQTFADSWTIDVNLDFSELVNVPLNSVTYSPGDNYLLISARDNQTLLIDIRTKSISRRYIGVFNIQDRLHSTFSSCGSLVFSGSEDGQVHCWHTYNGNLLYSYKHLNYTQAVIDIQFHPFDNILAMCSIGPLHQIYVFQHTFADADIEAKPLQKSTSRTSLHPATSQVLLSDNEQKSTHRFEDSSRFHAPSDTERNAVPIGVGGSMSGDDLQRSTTRTEHRNRRLAVVNKILDQMDDVINSKSASVRETNPISSLAGGHLISRSTERDVSPYQSRRHHHPIPPSGYNSDSGRPPLVSPLRGLTSPDLFVPTSQQQQYSPIEHVSSPPPPLMYATVNYTAQRPEELSFVKNDKIRILNKESHLIWYAEHVQTGRRGYISPNRVHLSAQEAYSKLQQRSTTTMKEIDKYSISEVPRLDNNSSHRRVQQKSVKFDSSD